MKKILTVSLCSMLAVCAANADIASVEYVTGELAGKQDTISDLATIRSGAALGATAAQDLGDLGVTATATELNYVDGVTSNIQTQLNAKQAKLNYTAENTANKVTSVTSTSTDTQYPSAKAMYTALAGKQASLGYTAENAANKVTSVTSTSTDTQYPSAKAMYTALSTKQNASTIGTVTAANMGTTAATVVEAISEVAGEAAAAQTTANAASASATTANNTIAAMDLAATGGDGKVIRSVTQTDGKVTASAEAVDTTPTSGSAKLITSGAVYSGLAARVAISQGTANAGKGLVVDRTTGNLTLTDIATQTELNSVSTSAATNALAALDYDSYADTAVGGDQVGEGGKYIVAVKQENGAVSILTKDYVDVITNEIMVAPTSNAVYDALALKQNSLGYTAENAANKVTSVTSTSSDTQYPSAKAVYTALSGKQNSLGYTAENTANKVTSVTSTSSDTQYPSAKAVYTAVSGKQNSSLGSTAANKAVITNASGNITSGTIATGMITDGAVTSAKIANTTITNDDISTTAAIEQSKISGLTTALANKQDAAPRDESGNSYFVATSEGVWKDMFNSMPKDRNCEQEGVKCALTHKSGAYAWEIVRE